MSLKRALWSFFIVAFIVSASVLLFPVRTTADSSVKVLDLSDKSHFEWVANGQSWFNKKAKIVPTRIVIRRLGVDAKLRRGGFDGNDWKISDDAVFFAPQVGEKALSSNGIFLYGHNSKELLGATLNLRTGDELMIKLDSGPWVKYLYTTSEVVSPQDILALTRNKTELTLLNCYGTNNEQRRIMHFSLKK